VLVGLAAALLMATVTYNSRDWVGRTVPGFLLLENRVVPSIALPEWTEAPTHFQHQVIAVDGQPVQDAAQVYAYVATRPAGTPIGYTFRRPDGSRYQAAVASRVFARSDYVFLFGSFLLSGAAFMLAGILVAWVKRGDAAATALLCCGLGTGLYGLTAVDLYGPYWFFRLHVVGEVLVGPVFLHLALVFPTNRVRGHERLAAACVYAPFALLIAWYELALSSPSAYSRVHGIATLGQALGGVAIITAVAFDLVTTRSPLVRRRLAIVALGTLTGFLVPTLLMAGTGLLGGSVAVNAAGLTAFFFPLSLAYGILKDDLFEIDVALRQAISYGIVVVLIAGVYFLVLYALGVFLPGQLSSWSPVALACLNFGLLFLLMPLRQRIQSAINRLFFRPGYQVDAALSSVGVAMAAARTLGDVATAIDAVLAHTCAPRTASILLFDAAGQPRELRPSGEVSPPLPPIELELAQHLEREGLVARYQWDDRGPAARQVWEALDAEVLVPIRANERLIALWRLGGKRSGRAYSADDSAFLRAAAPQLALALSNAVAFSELAELNAGLESKVLERTRELHRSNDELNRSLDMLRDAYAKLEQSQASLLRADRLATLGRLTAGIAHEMNTPLSAVMNALKVLQDLGQEYALSIPNPTVRPENHQEIAEEIVTTAAAAAKWAQKAASFIASVKAHGREAPSGAPQRVVLSTVVTETRELLAHRLRSASCQIDFIETEPGIALTGEAGRLSQVLLNLCANAIDAYEDAGNTSGRVEIRVERTGGRVHLTVRDWAGGIPPHVLPHIFDELYTTKGPGRGTGLGLWIARNLIEEVFRGSLTVETEAGVGSCFLLDLPAAGDAAAAPSTGAPAATAATGPLVH
jgi:signal transduction histidine kinase